MTLPDPDRAAAARPVKRIGRIAFANQLRGAAAILVACSHLIGVYGNLDLRRSVAAATFSPVQSGGLPALYHLIAYRWFEFGPFGVALFFLISGMVIPFSLEKHTRWTFLLARVLRIYPVFILALLFEILALYAASLYWHRPFTYGAGTIISNMLLVSSLNGSPVIDFVNWTLAIEVKFYLVVMLLATVIRRRALGSLFAAAAVMVMAEYLIAPSHHGTAATVLRGLSLELPYIVFMFIGILFNFHEKARFGAVALVLSVLGMSGLFIAAWRAGPLGPQYPVVTVNYLYAIGLFGLLYAARHWIRENRVLDFMASISYPFYLIHAVIGFTVMKYLMVAWHATYDVALAAAVIIITGFAYILHRTIELKTITMGHRLARRPVIPTTAVTTGNPNKICSNISEN